MSHVLRAKHPAGPCVEPEPAVGELKAEAGGVKQGFLWTLRLILIWREIKRPPTCLLLFLHLLLKHTENIFL